jgi:hypothetical protein
MEQFALMEAQFINIETMRMARILAVSRAGVSRGMFKVPATIEDSSGRFPTDLVDRYFDQGGLNAVKISAITYTTTGDRPAYLCTIRDKNPG